MFLYACLVFAVFQTSLSFPTTGGPVPFEDLAKALPLNEIRELKMKHLKDDQHFQAAVKYFKSPEWKAMVEDVRKTPEWIEYKNFIKEAGLDIDYYIQHIEHCVNASNTTEFEVDGVKPSLQNFLQDVKMTYGIQLLKGVQSYMAEKSDEHKQFKEQMLSDKSKELLENALKQPALQKFSKKLEEMDVNVEYALQMIYSLGGWGNPATGTTA